LTKKCEIACENKLRKKGTEKPFRLRYSLNGHKTGRSPPPTYGEVETRVPRKEGNVIQISHQNKEERGGGESALRIYKRSEEFQSEGE